MRSGIEANYVIADVWVANSARIRENGRPNRVERLASARRRPVYH